MIASVCRTHRRNSQNRQTDCRTFVWRWGLAIQTCPLIIYKIKRRPTNKLKTFPKKTPFCLNFFLHLQEVYFWCIPASNISKPTPEWAAPCQQTYRQQHSLSPREGNDEDTLEPIAQSLTWTLAANIATHEMMIKLPRSTAVLERQCPRTQPFLFAT